MGVFSFLCFFNRYSSANLYVHLLDYWSALEIRGRIACTDLLAKYYTVSHSFDFHIKGCLLCNNWRACLSSQTPPQYPLHLTTDIWICVYVCLIVGWVYLVVLDGYILSQCECVYCIQHTFENAPVRNANQWCNHNTPKNCIHGHPEALHHVACYETHHLQKVTS